MGSKCFIGLLSLLWGAQRVNNRKRIGWDWLLHWFLSSGAFDRRVAIQWSLFLGF